jgi:hypothetical protein
MNNIETKTMFFFKAFLAGIIGSSALYYYWGLNNEIIDYMLVNFHWYFGEVVIFWFWLGKELSIKHWLRAGFIGSIIYSVTLVVAQTFAERLIGKPFESIWADVVFIFISIIAGGLGAFPQWFVSRGQLNKAYQWIVVNAIGYGMLRFIYWLGVYIYENNFMSYREFIRSMPDVQWLNNLSHAARYGLLGIILGFALYNFVQNKSIADTI